MKCGLEQNSGCSLNCLRSCFGRGIFYFVFVNYQTSQLLIAEVRARTHTNTYTRVILNYSVWL